MIIIIAGNLYDSSINHIIIVTSLLSVNILVIFVLAPLGYIFYITYFAESMTI